MPAKVKPDKAIFSFKHNSVFFKMFLGLLMYTLLIIVLINTTVTNLLLDGNQKRYDAASLQSLQKVSDSVDLTISVLEQHMAQTIWSNEFISFLLNPERVDQNRDATIIRVLEGNVKGNGLVRNAFLYSNLTQQVFSSGGEITSLDSFTDKAVVGIHQSTSISLEERNKLSVIRKIHVYSGHIYVFLDLYLQSDLGAIVFELEPRELYRIIGGNEIPDNPIYVYDNANKPVFIFGLVYPLAETIPTDEARYLTPERIGETKYRGKVYEYYAYTSSSLQWLYIMDRDTNYIHIGFWEVGFLLLPVLSAILAACFMLYFYIAKRVYMPINRLMHTVAMPERQLIKDEIDYLQLAYQETLGKQAHLTAVIESITPDVLEQLLRRIITEQEIDDGYIHSILDGVWNPISVQDKFCVLAATTRSPQNRPSSSVEANLYFISISNILRTIKGPDFSLFHVPLEMDTLAVVLCFPPESSVFTIKNTIRKIERILTDHVHPLPYTLVLGKGKIYGDIRDIKYSYKEAKEELQYNLYMDMDTGMIPGENGEESSSDDSRHNRIYFQSRIRHILQASAEENKAEATNLTQRIMDEIAGDAHASRDAREMYLLLAEELTEQILTDHTNLLNDSGENLLSVMETLLTIPSADEMKTSVGRYFEDTIQRLAEHNRKNQNRYTAQVKEYIKANYMDSDLSLSKMSAHIGITPSYISDLFKSITGQNFSDYLNNYRTEKAKLLLAATTLTVKEIGYKCGFNSSQNFIRVFKRFAGCTPGQYRAANKVVR